MLDIRFIRDNADAVQENARRKNYEVDITKLLKLDDQRRELSSRADELRERRNANAAKMKGATGKPEQSVIDEGKAIKIELAELEELKVVKQELEALRSEMKELKSQPAAAPVAVAAPIIEQKVEGTPALRVAFNKRERIITSIQE